VLLFLRNCTIQGFRSDDRMSDAAEGQAVQIPKDFELVTENRYVQRKSRQIDEDDVIQCSCRAQSRRRGVKGYICYSEQCENYGTQTECLVGKLCKSDITHGFSFSLCLLCLRMRSPRTLLPRRLLQQGPLHEPAHPAQAVVGIA
jgi:hypothetical protein